jgi:hypothetical protein
MFPSGGTFLQTLLSANAVPPSSIWAIVRSDAQAESLKPLGVNTAQIALTDDAKIKRAVLSNDSEYSVHLISRPITDNT